TATEVSRPPEKAMPTFWPTGRDVRTLLNSDTLSGGRGVFLGQGEEPSGEGVPALRVARDDQHGVVAGDGAEHLDELGLVYRGGEELGCARRGTQHQEVGAGLGTHQQLGAQPGQ